MRQFWHLQPMEVDSFRPTVLHGGRCNSQGQEICILEELTISSQDRFLLMGSERLNYCSRARVVMATEMFR